MLPTEEELLTCDCPFCVAYRGRSGSVRGTSPGALAPCAGNRPSGGAGNAPAGKGPGAGAGAKAAAPSLAAPLKDPLTQGFKATAVIGISCKACLLSLLPACVQ